MTYLSKAERWLRTLPITLAILFALTACNQRQEAAETLALPTKAEVKVAPQGKPQPKLPTVKLWLGREELITEIASTSAQIQAGMMFRTNMAPNEGMIFVFSRPHRATFWMKNTLLPLSCAYIDAEGKILEILDMKPLDETGLRASSELVQYVLEVNQGYFKRHNIEPGMMVKTEKGSLSQTFFGR